MNAPAMFLGSYADLRFVKGRKVCQVVVELPIEEGQRFVAAFGAPNPAAEVPVIVSRFVPPAERGPETEKNRRSDVEEHVEKASPSAPKRKWEELWPSQQAGIRCNEPAFWRFLAEWGRIPPVNDPVTAAEAVRAECQVASRVELDHPGPRQNTWYRLDAEYRAWLREPEHV